MMIVLTAAVACLAIAVVVLLRANLDGPPVAAEPAIADQVKAATSDAVTQLMELHRQQREAEQQAAAAELARRETELKALAKPIADSVERVNRELVAMAKERVETKTLIEEMGRGVQGLATETAGLKKALRQPQTRGAWGEVQLRRCVELAGMTEHVDFELQQTLKTEDSWLRPDAVVMLPMERRIVVDSKVSLEAYLEALEAEDEETRQSESLRHARQVREHVEKLSSKRYQDQFQSGQTPDFVVCFVASEGALHSAFATDPQIYEHAIASGVLFATPTTLVGLLRTIELGWRQERIAEEAQQIAESGRELHSRFGKFFGDFSKVGRGLKSAIDAYNAAIGSAEARVMPQLRRFEALGSASMREVESPEPVDKQVRQPLVAPLEGGAIEADNVAELPGLEQRRA